MAEAKSGRRFTAPSADFAIEIDFERGTESPARVFKTMTGLIETFEMLDQALPRSLDIDLKPVLLLEDIETGSLRAWLRSEEALRRLIKLERSLWLQC